MIVICLHYRCSLWGHQSHSLQGLLSQQALHSQQALLSHQTAHSHQGIHSYQWRVLATLQYTPGDSWLHSWWHSKSPWMRSFKYNCSFTQLQWTCLISVHTSALSIQITHLYIIYTYIMFNAICKVFINAYIWQQHPAVTRPRPTYIITHNYIFSASL